MSQGTLYTLDVSPRSYVLVDLIKYFGLDIKCTSEKDEKFTTNFPLGKTPAFIGAKNFKLTEFLAIQSYLFSLLPKEKLGNWLGKNNQQYASILKYLSLINQEFIGAFIPNLKMITGKAPYNKKALDENAIKIDEISQILESRLKEFTYLVGERLTFADIFTAAAYSFALSTILGEPFVKKYPNIGRWFVTVSKSKFFGDRFAEFVIPKEPLTYTAPKKEKAKKESPAPQAAKKEAKPDAAKEVTEEPAAAPKPKHPLEALGKPKAPLDEWKRVYSNEETRETAIPWFWKNMYDPEDWSLYKVDYKYNDELTLTFMSNNLVGGFFNRLSASTKYMFGCMVVYGENNNNGITGAFLVRGQDYKPAFDVAPDWESYEFTKLDGSKEEVQKFVNNMLAWDEPVVVNGESREIADGKVFK
ncbi:unnamed protein product [Candida verbasci]|uniref:Uncharacterized protein n=1 Tax=Candida verbasci TaxID=1227364 RepID=A0A9W4TZU1_9ASCO|nr:unnamed protein product [Candida verbasci]